MRTPELEARHSASAAVSRMFFTVLKAALGTFPETNISAGLPDLLIAMAVRLNDFDRQPPISLSHIARMTGMPRATVRRNVEKLLERGVVVRSDDGIIGSDAYLLERIDADYFKAVVRAIRCCANVLKDFNAS